MKTVLVLLLSIVTVLGSAMPARRPFRKPLKPARVEMRHPVSWKTIAAGGAAAGTVIAAYKISDGVEDGMKIAAKEEPKGMSVLSVDRECRCPKNGISFHIFDNSEIEDMSVDCFSPFTSSPVQITEKGGSGAYAPPFLKRR